MDKKILLDEITEYTMANATMIEHALANKDMQMLKEAFLNFASASKEKENVVRLSFKEYIGNDDTQTRKIFFDIAENDLKQCLGIDKNSIVDINVAKFLENAEDEDIAYIYSEMSSTSRIMNEHIVYSDDFEKAYADYIHRIQMFNPDMEAKAIASKEDYYDKVYYENKVTEQESEQER